MLDRVREPALVCDEVRLHVRPICDQHGLDCDELLLHYVERCAAKTSQKRCDAAELERGVAVLAQSFSEDITK